MSDGKLYNVDIQQVIEDHIWKRYIKTKNLLLRPFCRRSNYFLDVHWGSVEFEHDTTKFKIRPDTVPKRAVEVPSETDTSASGAVKETDTSAADALKEITGRDEHGNKNVILYFSEYENDTGSTQTYTFTTHRETTASTSVSFEESYTKGAETSIEISVPGDFLTIGAGLSGELTVTESKGQSFEETMSWDVNTEINVEARHRTQATVYIAEKDSYADFEVKTTMALKDEKDLPVAVKRRSDNKTVWIGIVTDFEPVFSKIVKKADNITLVDRPDEKRRMLRQCVVMTTRGSCKSVSWKNQQVKVTGVKLDSPSSPDKSPTKSDKSEEENDNIDNQ